MGWSLNTTLRLHVPAHTSARFQGKKDELLVLVSMAFHVLYLNLSGIQSSSAFLPPCEPGSGSQNLGVRGQGSATEPCLQP